VHYGKLNLKSVRIRGTGVVNLKNAVTITENNAREFTVGTPSGIARR